MTKHKKFIDLNPDNIQYTQDNNTFILQTYNKITMTVTVYSLGEQRTITIPFAHLPKKIKKIINPK